MTVKNENNFTLPIPNSSIYEINKLIFDKRNINIFDITLKSKYQIIAKRIFKNMKSNEFLVKTNQKTLLGDIIKKKNVLTREDLNSLSSESLNKTITNSNMILESHSSDEIQSSFDFFNEDKHILNK